MTKNADFGPNFGRFWGKGRGKENDESTRDLEGDLNSLGWVAKKEEEDTLEQGDGLGEEKSQVGPRESLGN